VKKTASEVYMVLLVKATGENGDGTVNLVGTAYDLRAGITTAGRALMEGEIPGTLREYVELCFNDMNNVAKAAVLANAKALLSDPTKDATDVYVKLLVEFADKPIELVGNMLASLLAACTVNAVADPEMADEIDAWESES